MGTVQPLNIIRLVGTNERYAAAEEYNTDVQKTNIVCSWHEKQYQKSRTRNLEVNFQEDVDLGKSVFDEHSEMVVEMGMANKSVKILRKERLRELLKRDYMQYEAELNAKGLAIDKHIDSS